MDIARKGRAPIPLAAFGGLCLLVFPVTIRESKALTSSRPLDDVVDRSLLRGALVEDPTPQPILIKKTPQEETPPPSKEEEARQQALIQSDPSRNYLIKQWRNRSQVTFICYSKPITGQIRNIRKYDLFLHDRTKAVNKVEILYLYKPDVAPSVQKAVRVDPDVTQEKLRSLRKKSLRLEIPEATLAKCFEEQRVITVTMRNGHVLVGTIHSYGVFSVRLTLAPETRVILMRHSIYDLAFDRRTHQGIQTATTSSRSK